MLNQPGKDKVKCNMCRSLRKLSKWWKIEQSTCLVQKSPLGLPKARWPNVWRLCTDFEKGEE